MKMMKENIMPQHTAVRIEHYTCNQTEAADCCTYGVDTPQIRDLYAVSKEDSTVPWETHIPCNVDYIQVINVSCTCDKVDVSLAHDCTKVIDLYSAGDDIDRGAIYPNGTLYTVKEAHDSAALAHSALAAQKDVIEKMAQENVALVVVTRGGNVKAFDDARDVILRQGNEKNKWYNDIGYAKARAYAYS